MQLIIINCCQAICCSNLPVLGQKTPRHIPPNKNPPRQKGPRQKPPRVKSLCFIFLKFSWFLKCITY